MRRFPWLALLLFLAGAGIGVLYAWVVAPAPFKDTAPNTLRSDFKDEIRALIAASYASTGDLERARARLVLLEDPNPLTALNAQAQQMLAAGKPFEDARQVAQLAADLQQQPLATAPEPARPPATSTPILVITLPTAAARGLTETVIPQQVIEAPATVSTATPRPTRSPTPLPGRAYELAAQETLCETGLQEGLLQVIVTDARRRPVAGAEIIVTWDGGEERFFSGFKPELGNGYADFVTQPGLSYTVRVGMTGAPVTNVTPPVCASADGASFTGVIRLNFQQP